MGKSSNFVLLGERCSGTNIIEAAVQLNASCSASQAAGFKHFPNLPDAETASRLRDLPVIVVVRHPVEWAKAMYAHPWHAAPHLLSVNFSEFLRAEWYSVWNEQAFVPPDDPRYGKEMMSDRDPFTGQRYENLLRMRSGKMKLFLELASAAKTRVVVRLEDYAKNPTEVISRVCDAIGGSKRGSIQIPDGYKGRLSWKRRVASALGLRALVDKVRPPQRMRPKPTVDKVDEEFIWSQLDMGAERLFGYTPLR